MQNSYKISLITPVYNAADYIGFTFDSVKAQALGFDAIEWLLVDDCSSDGRRNIRISASCVPKRTPVPGRAAKSRP